ncbi:MAG: endonuclease [Moheibacter sp.]
MVKINKTLTIFTLFSLFFSTVGYAQQNYKAATVAFYNLENLFDTKISAGYIDGTRDPLDPSYHISISEDEISDFDTVSFKNRYTYENIEGKKIIRPLILQKEQFSPQGTKVWTENRYNQKLKNLSQVISQLGKEETKSAPVIVGFCEIENREVVQDLIDQPELKKHNYGIAHFNSFDARGVDVALIYQKSRFQVTKTKPYIIEIYANDGSRKYTRDILQVTGLLDGEEITFLVNHWPSRSGGEQASMPFRKKAAEVMKGVYDEIRSKNPDAKIMAMGDFNDDPVSPSIAKTLGAISDKSKIKDSDIVDLMYSMFKKGMGTLAYRDSWNLFDQFIVTGTLIDKSKKFDSYKVFKTKIFSPSYLITPEGQYKGYPYRMFGGDTYYPNGYSDHFPVYTVLLKEVK